MGFPIPISGETNFQLNFPYYIAVYRHIRLWNKVTYKQKRKALPYRSLRKLGMGNKVMSFAGAEGKGESLRMKQHTRCNAHSLSLIPAGLESFCLLEERYLTIIPRAQMGSESIAHEADSLRGDRNNCFSKIQLVDQKNREKTTLSS